MDKHCSNCDYFSAKVIGPDGPKSGKCFLANEHVAYVDAEFYCPEWIPEIIYPDD